MACSLIGCAAGASLSFIARFESAPIERAIAETAERAAGVLGLHRKAHVFQPVLQERHQIGSDCAHTRARVSHRHSQRTESCGEAVGPECLCLLYGCVRSVRVVCSYSRVACRLLCVRWAGALY